ncbi:accessory gland protein Acp29AB-like [Drosophila subpulchrella]|uniref:accessory gland protein Acp29AB-like n=1 Tax=Drosophila subpulchrella TaxID=1486046 RepID=UPI0018A166BD|nr:accessory gland protein Acp29AB-like [Drosophila subpulchrella]
MLQYATYFLYVLVSWDVWITFAQHQNIAPHHSAVYNPQSALDQIGVHQQQWFSYNSLRQALTDEKINKLEMGLLALQKELESQLQTLRKLQEFEKERIIVKRIIKPIFEKIGSRYFYIEKQIKVNWYAAFNKCRQMGGHLANIQDWTELHAIFSRVPRASYWIDMVMNTGREGNYLSTLTGKMRQYARWWGTQYDNDKNNCVDVYGLYMYKSDCHKEYFFVCQAEPWY